MTYFQQPPPGSGYTFQSQYPLIQLQIQPPPPPIGKQPSAPAPVVNVKELMNLFNKPLYLQLKTEMAQRPLDNKGWATIEERSLQAAEVANLIVI